MSWLSYWRQRRDACARWLPNKRSLQPTDKPAQFSDRWDNFKPCLWHQTWLFWWTPQESFQPCWWRLKSRYFQGDVKRVSSRVWGDKNVYFKSKNYLFGTLTKCFLCINLIGRCNDIKLKITTKVSTHPWFPEEHSANIYSGDVVVSPSAVLKRLPTQSVSIWRTRLNN